MIAIVRASPKRPTIVPASGMLVIDPAATHSRMKPSCAGLTARLSRICGMRDAQLAKANPERMNAT